MKKTLRGDANTAVVRRSQKFSPPPHIPLPGGVGQPKFIRLEMVTTFTYKPSLVRINARNFASYHGNRPTHTHTHRQDRLQHTVPQLARSVTTLTQVQLNCITNG